MAINQELLEEATANECRLADGFEDCIIGMCYQFGQQPRVAYDYEKMIKKMMKRDKMSRQEAEEFYSYNIEGAWMGAGTPVYIRLTT